ncbi:alpha/beta hydrolase [Nostoc sp. ChiVER01]|uniref:alpha/beta hydrolase n=1 Tax=Nostoc sp. ChiVER01 TaxID=3075382 RepID=UPI002AD47C0A|nr:alpha/beta hydrolase [Nostoc sp. ChiVER01]MDZ8227969.1 alpha/beta hydrolase [Nostoc sp. ChiVER01]
MDILVDNLFIEPTNAPAPQGIPGYLIRSTARANVEDLQDIKEDNTRPTIQTIIDLLYTKSKKLPKNSEELGIVIAIHGYNTGGADSDLTTSPVSNEAIADGIWKNYQKLCKYINSDALISQKSDSLVFLGYRWPSETIKVQNITTSLSTLPFLLKVLLWGSLIVAIASVLLFFWLSSPIFVAPIILGTFGFGIVFSLIILRVIVYFRDSYRAINYGVHDLVELIRQLDKGLMECCLQEDQSEDKAQTYWKEHPIKLSFIGHSLGSQVTTQAVRILSDVFDSNSVGNINDKKAGKRPSSRIGQVFSLGRLILIAPDIPALAITSGRSNFLRSSLRRFEEAYLFSNEGDLALRLASTAANYFSFPAKTQTQGYRLGNVTVRSNSYHSSKLNKVRGQSESKYGIVNWKDRNLCKPLDEINSLLDYLEINVLNKVQNQGLDPANQEYQSTVTTAIKDRESLASLFTYFDCTEYKERTNYANAPNRDRYMMILDKQTSPLTFLEYVQLGWAYFRNNTPDVHGGYFWGKFSQQLICQLAFVGFQEFIEFLLVTSPQDVGIEELRPPQLEDKIAWANNLQVEAVSEKQRIEKRQIALNYLSWIVEKKQIQAVLSPERYYIDVMGEKREEVRSKIMMSKK